jgi:hypothetical protein
MEANLTRWSKTAEAPTVPNRPCRREWAVARPAEQKLAHLLQSYELLISRVEVKPWPTAVAYRRAVAPCSPANRTWGVANRPARRRRWREQPAQDVFGRHPKNGAGQHVARVVSPAWHLHDADRRRRGVGRPARGGPAAGERASQGHRPGRVARREGMPRTLVRSQRLHAVQAPVEQHVGPGARHQPLDGALEQRRQPDRGEEISGTPRQVPIASKCPSRKELSGISRLLISQVARP